MKIKLPFHYQLKINKQYKPLKSILPIGCDCHPAYMISKLELRNESLPFDWLDTKPSLALHYAFINVKDNAFLDPTIIPDGDPVAKFTYQGQTYNNVPRENLINHPALFGYTVFGKVTSGMDVVNKIKKVPTGASGPFSSDVPKTPIIIEKAVTLP